MAHERLLSILSAASFATALLHGSAAGALNNYERGCINAMNKALGKIADAQGKEGVSCVRNASKGRESNPQSCLTADVKGKVDKAVRKATRDDAKKCGSVTPLLIGYTGASTVALAAKTNGVDLMADIFGPDLNPVISTDKFVGGCQATVIKDVQRIVDAKLKEFIKCKKDALRAGAMTTGDLESCVTPGGIAADPKGKILETKTKLGASIARKCTGVNVASTFPGPCSGETLGTLGGCLDERAECRVCLAINAADGLSADCDLFDDGLANGSCPPRNPIGWHKCTFDNSGPSPGKSRFVITTQAFALPPFPASGAIDVNCGRVDPATGKAPCECDIQDLDPIEIINYGFICFSPGAPCPTGEIDCNGGNGLDVTMASDHNIGACVSNAGCQASCTAHCTGNGQNYFASGCEGYCIGGSNDGNPCDNDTNCPGGSCPGRSESNQHDDICQCDCTDTGGAASAAGDLQCNMSVSINVEANAPCDGTDVTIALGTRCIPLTSAAVTSQIVDANNTPAKLFPPVAYNDSGVGIDCNDLRASITTGIKLVGSVNFFDTSYGDMHTTQTLTCQ